ncbi:glycosyltransferase family 2 protein [Mesorhizobium sp. VNQ89]|uniref:glycosyltransferase family 2 protein n=1 Tax=Mesorhizobium quangtriensis TaxID=3157709 RepID=UPI0032B704AD
MLHEPLHLRDAAVPRDRPFEGSFSSLEQPRRDGPRGGFDLVQRLYPKTRDWLPVLQRLRISPDAAIELARLSSRNGTDFLAELMASELVDGQQLCRALAENLGLTWEDEVDPDRLVISREAAMALLAGQRWHHPVGYIGADGVVGYLLAPQGIEISALRSRLEGSAEIARKIKLVAPDTLRAALLDFLRPDLLRQATMGLFDRHSYLSARMVANAWQGGMVGVLLVAIPGLLLLAPGTTWLVMHVVFSLFFLACIGLRFFALAAVDRKRSAPPPRPQANMPVYSLLVALYREAEVVPELVAALERIEWPRSKLDIKLVCEADDAETLRALRVLQLPGHMEIVEVPPSEPRTKPKALAYALPLARGEVVALYDAEDHPHPNQLLHAWQTFLESPDDVACVQAPLEIANRGASILARMFAFEYAALFRGMLPWLSGKRLPVPLGGTSNHFRRAAIEQAGGWDPYNVTEDADLGMRLARFGYRTETIRCPTWETAPEHLSAWLPQRTRWFKGWVQTWLVHMRHPWRLLRELGFWPFFVGQILFAGMVMSALAHPFLLLTGVALAIDFALERQSTGWKSTLLAIDLMSVAGGYLSFLLLGWQVLKLREKLGFWKIVLFTPVYWMMLSWAAWRAVWQLWRTPFLWEKTPHRPLRAGAVLPRQ